MAATLDLTSPRIAPTPTPASPSATPSSRPVQAYPSPPDTCVDGDSAEENEQSRGRWQLPDSSEPGFGRGETDVDHGTQADADADAGGMADVVPPASPNPSTSSSSLIVKQRRRAPSSSKSKTNDNVHRLTAAEMHELTSAPESLPIAAAPQRRSMDQDSTDKKEAAHLDAGRSSWTQMGGEPNGLLSAEPWPPRDEHMRPSPPRTVSTPPTTRVRRDPKSSSSQPTSPRRYSFNPSVRPPPLNLNLDLNFHGEEAMNGALNGRLVSPAIKTGPAVLNTLPSSANPLSQGCVGPSPPSPIPSMIPLPPMSIPTHLQLELAAERPSPLYIHQSHLNDVPYESYAVKLERLKNVLLLPTYLERTLYFGALACLDAWLHTFTILPIRFFIALGVLLRWWALLLGEEINRLCGYVGMGLQRLWNRGRAYSSARSGIAPEPRVSRSRSHPLPEELVDPGVTSATTIVDGLHTPRIELHAVGDEAPRVPQHTSDGSSNPGLKPACSGRGETGSTPSALSAFHKADLLQGAVIICSSVVLMTLDASRMYHFIRAQSAIKLYVIYNILEVGDRLLSALGQDILECLFSSETLSRDRSGRSKVLVPFGMFILALVYNCLHSIALYYQVITLNVAVNSYSNALLTLLLSNQFVEIKSTVFKRIEKDNLFQLTCADIVERFHLWIMLLIIGMRNMVEVGAFSVPGAGFDSSHEDGGASSPLQSPSLLPHSFTVLPSWMKSGEALSPFLIVVGSEMLVDSIKHAYVTKFNNIKPTFYGRTLDILCKDYYTNAFVSPSLTRRLGLAVVPLSCLFIRASVQTYHMFLSTHVPMPLPPSTHTSLASESAVPSSPAMMAALSRFDALLRDSLGRATYGYPYGSPLNSRPWYAWTSDDLIAALTMVVVFFIVFLVLLILKLLLGMLLLQYSRNRYAKMKHKEQLVALGQRTLDSYDAKGRRVGGLGHVQVTDDKARWISADQTEGLSSSHKGPSQDEGRPRKKRQGDYMGVARYEMVAKRIW